MIRPLKRFAVAPHGDGYSIILETSGGESFEVSASFEQLDLLAEEIDRRLDADDDQAPPLGDTAF